MKNKVFILYLLIVFSSFASAQDQSPVISDLNNFLKVGNDLMQYPLHFDGEDWVYFGGTIAITSAAYLFDHEAQEIAVNNLNLFNDKVFSLDKTYYYHAVILSIAGLYGYGLIAENPKVRNLSLKLVESTVYATLITGTLKFLVGRKRPYENKGKSAFEPFSDFDASFPSGHSTLAFAYASVMAAQIDNIFWKIGWYSAASMVAAARVYHNFHWFSDVFFGGAIGYFVGQFVNNHSSNDINNECHVSLLIGLDQIGFRYTF